MAWSLGRRGFGSSGLKVEDLGRRVQDSGPGA